MATRTTSFSFLPTRTLLTERITAGSDGSQTSTLSSPSITPDASSASMRSMLMSWPHIRSMTT
jgi:hypothetical protein